MKIHRCGNTLASRSVNSVVSSEVGSIRNSALGDHGLDMTAKSPSTDTVLQHSDTTRFDSVVNDVHVASKMVINRNAA